MTWRNIAGTKKEEGVKTKQRNFILELNERAAI
jgi:hypothetical protein